MDWKSATLYIAIGAAAWLLAVQPLVQPAISAAQTPALDKITVSDAYAYLLGRALVIRQEHTDLAEAGVAYNVVKYNPVGSADFANPNLDVAYLRRGSQWTIRHRSSLKSPKSRGATKQGALNLVGDLGLREMTGRGRFRAWGRFSEILVKVSKRMIPAPEGRLTEKLAPLSISRIKLHPTTVLASFAAPEISLLQANIGY